MNLILLFDEDFNVDSSLNDKVVVIRGRRLQHINSVHRAKVGDQLSVGKLNGLIGRGTVRSINEQQAVLEVCLDQQPPAPLPLTLILALPRPQMLKRTIQTIATMGVKRLILINSNRVEKSFWQTPVLNPESLHEHLLLGLEQAKDTQLPRIEFYKRFRPFIEDAAAEIIGDSRALVAHPGPYPDCPHKISEATTLAVGPEGGFVPYEIERFEEAGFSPISLGDRILKVETAIPVLLAKLF